MKLRKVGIISLGLSVISFLLFMVLMAGVSTINTGCSQTPVSATATATSPQITFQITNNSSVANGIILYLNVKSTTAGTAYDMNTYVKEGTSTSEVDYGPGNDTYNVSIINSGGYTDTWNSVTLSEGSTYLLVVSSNNSSATLGGATCNSCQF